MSKHETSGQPNHPSGLHVTQSNVWSGKPNHLNSWSEVRRFIKDLWTGFFVPNEKMLRLNKDGERVNSKGQRIDDHGNLL